MSSSRAALEGGESATRNEQFVCWGVHQGRRLRAKSNAGLETVQTTASVGALR